ncbi:MAG: riboflavin synthase [Desulfovibrio sp.]|jgi:riboflavin synthase|nr:riboflavin synthase [Desulfovibrio sp.]
MFTGIIQGLGEIVFLDKKNGECRLTLRSLFNLENIVDGESIAVNGVCLSVETHGKDDFTVYASRETLRHTVVGEFSSGRQVNLERSLAVGDRLGGHLVSGHVDCLAHVQELRHAGQSFVCSLSFPEEYGPEIIPRGSVALDGISLTVDDCGRDFLTINVIPDTRKRTCMRWWRAGSCVHMETDMIGKYVRRLIAQQEPPRGGNGGMSRKFLLENGFL